MPTLKIQSTGGGAGLYVHRSGSGQFTLTVLVVPKVWAKLGSSPGGIRSGAQIHIGDGHTVVTAVIGEGCATHAVVPCADPASFVRGIEQVSEAMAARRRAWRARTHGGVAKANGIAFGGAPREVPDSESHDDEDVTLEDAVSQSVAIPVDCGLRFTAKAEPSTSARPVGDPDALGHTLRALVWLCFRNRVVRHDSAEGGADENDGHLVDPTTEHEQDPLALMAELDFVSELHRLQHRIRKGYVPTDEHVSAIRGRITERGVLDNAMTGLPVLECRFDEFVETTPLFRVLVTALDVVASGSIRDALGVGTDWFGERDSIHPRALREQLRNIPSMTPLAASTTADQLRLTPLQYEWVRPLHLARRILRMESAGSGRAEREGGATVWSMDMPALWERVLTNALREQQVAPAQVVPQAPMPPPWMGLGTTRRVDLRLTIGTSTFIIDAKYKDRASGPSPADQYQIFAYSLLSSDAPTAVALVYPTKAAEIPWEAHDHTPATSHHFRCELNAHVDADAPRPMLHVLAVPFPSGDEVSNTYLWRRYLASTGETLVAALHAGP